MCLYIRICNYCAKLLNFSHILSVKFTQFEIIGITENADYLKPLYLDGCEKYDRPYVNGKRMYSRLLIKKVS